MKRLALATLLALACTELTGDFGDVVAIEVLTSSPVTVEEQDTVVLEARALDLQGNPIADAPIAWEVLRRDTLPVGIALDTASGRVVAMSPGTWDVRARVEALPANPVTIRVTPAPDSIAATGDTAVTVAAGAVQSSILQVTLLDLTTTPGTAATLGGKLVTFRLTFPVFAPGARTVTLANGTVGEDSLTAAVTTSTQGAGVFVRRSGSPQPDSVIVEAAAMTAVGGTVAGTPIRFVVHFPVN